MPGRLAIVYNEPLPSRYDSARETKAVLGVLDSVRAVEKSLQELGYEAILLPLSFPLELAKRKLEVLDVEIVFNLFEGFSGCPETEAFVPETLDGLGIPYTGCSGTIIRLALDKARIKEPLKAAGIPTPDFQLLAPQTLGMFRLGFPCIVKPVGEDASHGLNENSVVDDFGALENCVRAVSDSYGGKALVEEFIDGREFNATVLGNSVLPASEIVYSLPQGMPRILTFAAKWEPDSSYFLGTRAVCPAEVSTEEEETMKQTALSVFRQLGCRGYARVDMRQDRDGRLNVIELNPNPDISPDAGAARQAEAAGMPYTQFIERIIEIAHQR